jgi:hypothetical protein
MSAVLALINARRAGASISVEDGKLIVRSDGPLSADVQAALRAHKTRLIQLLQVDPGIGDRPHWRTFDGHDCWTACEREHVTCNACGQALAEHDHHWPWLHPNCRLERLD